MKVFTFLLMLLFSSLSLATVYTAPSKTTPYKGYQISIDGSFFQPASRFDLDGEKVPYNDLEDYSLIEGNLTVRYGFTQQLELFGGVRVRMVESIDQAGESLSNSGAESIMGGLKYSLPRWAKGWSSAIELSYRQTAYSNDLFEPGEQDNDNIILGDDGASFKAGAHISKDDFFLSSQLRTYFAYHRPANELSQELLYDVSLLWKSGAWVYGGGVQGISSFGLDEPESRPGMNTGNTNLFNSVNREKIEPYFALSRQLGQNSHVDFQASQVMSGTSTDEGLNFMLGLTWGTQGVSRRDMKIDSFKEYILEASVIKVSPRGAFVQIDKGVGQDVQKGMRFDIFQTDFFGGNVLVASGVVYETTSSSAIIRLGERYNDIKIEPGFRARGR